MDDDVRDPATAEPLLGALEAAAMRVLWQGHEYSVAAVLGLINAERDKPLAYTTVMTVLTRLHDKGLAARRSEGRQYVYRAALPESALLDAASERAVAALVARYGTSALVQFAQRLDELDPATRAELSRLASDRQKR